MPLTPADLDAIAKIRPVACQQEGRIDSLEALVRQTAEGQVRLEESHHKLSQGMRDLCKDMSIQTKTLDRIADVGLQIVELRSEVEVIRQAHDKSCKDHNIFFDRLRNLESVGCPQRLEKLEKDWTWITRLVIGALILGSIGLGFHAIKAPQYLKAGTAKEAGK